MLQLKLKERTLSVFITFTPYNANQEVSNTIHVGSVSDILDRLAAASECMASILRTRLVVGEGAC